MPTFKIEYVLLLLSASITGESRLRPYKTRLGAHTHLLFFPAVNNNKHHSHDYPNLWTSLCKNYLAPVSTTWIHSKFTVSFYLLTPDIKLLGWSNPINLTDRSTKKNNNKPNTLVTMADTEKNGAEATMPSNDVSFLITCLQNSTGGSICVSSPSTILTSLSLHITLFIVLVTTLHSHHRPLLSLPRVSLNILYSWDGQTLTCILQSPFIAPAPSLYLGLSSWTMHAAITRQNSTEFIQSFTIEGHS